MMVVVMIVVLMMVVMMMMVVNDDNEDDVCYEQSFCICYVHSVIRENITRKCENIHEKHNSHISFKSSTST